MNSKGDIEISSKPPIFENNREHLADFIRLNEDWISIHFTIEGVDRDPAANPGQIIDNGGYIFSLVNNNEVVGVSALFHEGSGVFQLGRMAISPGLQGNGYGGVLMQTCLEKLREIDASKVYLLSNTKLDAAIALYKKYGFETTHFGEHAVYARANIVMERNVL